jgi:branched-chain amino acid transport system permease protein
LQQFLQQLVNGIVLGATYGLIALGYTMVYGIIQLINFAHGEIFMVGAFAGVSMYKYALPESVQSNVFVVLPTVLLASIVVSVATALAVERLAYRPLRNAPRLAPLITAIGVSIFLQELVRLFYPGGKSQVSFPRIIEGPNLEVGGVAVARTSLFLVVVALLLMLGLQTFIRTSRTGKAMRATSQDPDTARLMGIDTNRIIVITFAIGAMLAGVAGVMQGMRFISIDFRIGFLAGLKAFTAAVLGGIGNITGAMLGGFVLGLVEAMATQYLPLGSGYKDVWAFVVLIAVLVFRPAGLLGERVAARS